MNKYKPLTKAKHGCSIGAGSLCSKSAEVKQGGASCEVMSILLKASSKNEFRD
jgi:hypothetical protein